jgi:hypothetical protein
MVLDFRIYIVSFMMVDGVKPNQFAQLIGCRFNFEPASGGWEERQAA